MQETTTDLKELLIDADHNKKARSVVDNRHVCPHHGRGRRLKTREKIEKLVNDGAKNYPAYLKLIYTGDSDMGSDFSSDEEGVHYEREQRKLKEVERATKYRNEHTCKAQTPEEKSALEERIPERMNKSDSGLNLISSCIPKGKECM